MVAASRGHFETVTGDGVSSIEQLVHTLNQDPRRGEAYTDPLGVLKLDAAAKIELAKQGMSIDSIPAADQVILIRRTGDLTTDCTDEVHPLTASQAVLAARVVGLDVAGLDVLAEDISKPLAPQRGAVVEVNAGPSLSCHVVPMFGKPRPVGEAIIDMLFPAESSWKIPIHGLLVSAWDANSKSHVDEWLESHSAMGILAGAVLPDSVRIANQSIDLEDCDSHAKAFAALGNPLIETILVVLLPNELLRHGLPVPRLDSLTALEGSIQSAEASGTQQVFQLLSHCMPNDSHPLWLKDCLKDA